MFEDNELEEIELDEEEQASLSPDHSYDDDGGASFTEDRLDAFANSRQLRFGVSMVAATGFLIFVIVITLSVAQTPAVGVGSVGGFNVAIDRMEGRDVAFYPGAGETSACMNTSADRTPESGDDALPVVEAVVGQASIPASSNIQIQKDVKLPDTIPSIDTVRVTLNRYQVPSNPNYPPLADANLYGDSDGIVQVGSETTFLQSLNFDGIDQTPSLDNQGYRDFTDLRSNNQTAGTTPGNTIAMDVVADIMYGEADTTPYGLPGGTNPDRYIDQVSFAGDSTTFTGNDGGYRDGTSTVFGNVTQSTSESLTVDAVGSPTPFDDAVASRFPGSDGITDTFDYRVAGVDYAGISSSSGSDDGYLDNTAQHTATLPKGNTSTITVDAERNDISSFKGNGQADVIGDTGAMDPSNLGCGSFCGEQDLHIYQMGWDGNSYNTPTTCSTGDPDADGYQDYTSGYWTANMPFVPTTTHTLQVTIDGSDDDGNHNVWAWIDWDDDGDYDGTTPGGQAVTEFYTVATDQSTGTDGTCPDTTYTTDITVPGNVFTDVGTYRDFDNGSEPGPVSMRVVAAYEGNCPSTAGPGQDFSQFNGCGGEKEDYTVDVEEPASHFAAWADWDGDGDLMDANEVVDLPDGHRNQGGISFSISDSITVPLGAIGGSKLLRVTHKAGYPSIQTVEPAPDEGVSTFVGETEDYTVEVQSDGEANIKAWIDWNQDGDFSEFNEEIDLGSAQFPATDGPFTLGPTTVSVPAGAEAGTTVMRVGMTMEAAPPTPDGTGDPGEYEDYTVHVDPDENVEVRAWIDWDQDGDFFDANEDYDLGSISPSTYVGQETTTASAPLGTVPSTAPDGVTMMRVTAEMGGIPGPTPGAPDTFHGETEDFTVVVGPQTPGPDYDRNVTVGDATFRLSDLKADSISVETAVIDEDYSNNSTAFPTLTRDGEFVISGRIVDIRNLDARAHFLSFERLRFPFANLTLQYNPPSPAVKTDNTCLGIA